MKHTTCCTGSTASDARGDQLPPVEVCGIEWQSNAQHGELKNGIRFLFYGRYSTAPVLLGRILTHVIFASFQRNTPPGLPAKRVVDLDFFRAASRPCLQPRHIELLQRVAAFPGNHALNRLLALEEGSRSGFERVCAHAPPASRPAGPPRGAEGPAGHVAPWQICSQTADGAQAAKWKYFLAIGWRV